MFQIFGPGYIQSVSFRLYWILPISAMSVILSSKLVSNVACSSALNVGVAMSVTIKIETFVWR